MQSPLGGFLIQRRSGESGNFEVVVPRPSGGLAHFWRDNDDGSLEWKGPTPFGTGDYTGATVIESDFRFFDDLEAGNLEVAAVRADGRVDHYWRENGGNFVWHGPFPLPFGSAKRGNPAMAYTGAQKHDATGGRHSRNSFYLVAPNANGGFAYFRRLNEDNGTRSWALIEARQSPNVVGVGLALTTVRNRSGSTGYKYTGAGDHVVAAVTETGQLELHVYGLSDASGISRGWVSRTSFGRSIFRDLDGRFVGRPCLIQGDYNYVESSAFTSGHYGNLELVAPAKDGGLLHFWRDCGAPNDGFKKIGEDWGGPVRIGEAHYDEVSLLQSNFSRTDRGNLELIARRRDQHGFDFYWRDEQGRWAGPHSVGSTSPVDLRWQHSTPGDRQVRVAAGTSPTSWYTPVDNVQHIAYVGEDNMIHECHYRIGPGGQWEHAVPNEGQVPARPATGLTSWYTSVDNVQHIAYIGEDNMIHECHYRIGPGRQWEHAVPNEGQAPVHPGGAPTSWYTSVDNVQHIAYVGVDTKIHECHYRIGPGRGWEHAVPSEGAAVPGAAGGTWPTSWYTALENVQHIAYVDEHRTIRECFFRIGPGRQWEHAVPCPEGVRVRQNTSPTSWYSTPDGVQHIGYVDGDGRVRQCYYSIAGPGGWQHEITNAGHVPAAPSTSPAGWCTTSENVQHVAYVGTDGRVHECFFVVRPGAPHVWHHNVPSDGHVAAALDASPTGWFSANDNVQHLAYVGVDRQIQECFFAIR